MRGRRSSFQRCWQDEDSQPYLRGIGGGLRLAVMARLASAGKRHIDLGFASKGALS